MAGSADFKTELAQSDMFDQRLQAKIIKLVDVSYGGENGFNQEWDLTKNICFLKKTLNGAIIFFKITTLKKNNTYYVHLNC